MYFLCTTNSHINRKFFRIHICTKMTDAMMVMSVALICLFTCARILTIPSITDHMWKVFAVILITSDQHKYTYTNI